MRVGLGQKLAPHHLGVPLAGLGRLRGRWKGRGRGVPVATATVRRFRPGRVSCDLAPVGRVAFVS